MKPFLKWAGSKYKLCQHILPLLPPGKRLVEPFLGTGSIFLNTSFPEYLLAEKNEDLVNLYQCLKKEGRSFIEKARCYFKQENNTLQQYMLFRERFNTILGNPSTKQERALLFIYLNRYSYNGLCRYNNKGYYNVPFGRYTQPFFPEEAMWNFHIKSQTASFYSMDFRETLAMTQKGDVVYCDPPYVPLQKKSFQYTSQNFSEEDQKDLVLWAEKLSSNGIPVIISNHDTPQTRDYYQNASQLISINVRRVISCKTRQQVAEIIAVFK